MKKLLTTALICSISLGEGLFAQHLDEVHFGNNTSEQAHGLTSYNPSKTESYTGLLNQSGRRFLEDITNPFQGQYTGIYGGEVNLVVRIDGSSQNYFTVKFSGSESSDERILLEVEGKEVGNRYHGDEDFFFGEFFAPCKGAFGLRTLPIPRVLTDGKTEVTVRLRSTGRFYGYGGGGYESFQRAMTAKTSGIYKLYVHTDPGFTIPESELAGGSAPSYSTASTANATSLSAMKAKMVSNANSYFTGLLNGSDFIKTDPNNYFHPIEALAHSYFVPEITATYQNSAVIEKMKKLIDNMVVNCYNGGQTASACWGGAFGRQGYAIAMLFDHFPAEWLDTKVNLGGGATRTRRFQWCQVLRTSFEYGATSRKTITNQEMENDMSVYGAALALNKLDPKTYGEEYTNVGYHMLLESCGIEQFTDKASMSSGKPVLGKPANSPMGEGYYYMTEKGTSHEPGWVSTDCYGNLGPKITELYLMTKLGLGGDGDKRVLDMAVKHVKTQAMFSYPFVGSDGKKDILTAGYICWRNVSVPGKRFYGNEAVAGISKDPELLGYFQQQVNDGRCEEGSFTATSTQFVFEAIAALQQEGDKYTAVMPSTPGQPDYAYADEENGVVSIKKGDEQLFITMYARESGDNKMVRIHHILPNYQRFVECHPIKNEFRNSGKTRVRSRRVNGFLDSYGVPPDNPESALNGQVEYYNSYNGTDKYSGSRLIKDYYFVRYGKYLIAMNTLKGVNKTIEFPADVIGKNAYQFHTSGSVVLPATMTIPSRTTYVFILDETAATNNLFGKIRTLGSIDKSALSVLVSEKELFAQLESTRSKVSLTSKEGYYKPDLFLSFMRALSLGKYMMNYDNATQAQVTDAMTVLTEAYRKLTEGSYAYNCSELPGVIDLGKRIATGGSIKIDADGSFGETTNGAYVVIPVKATKAGDYVITVKASSNRDSEYSPRVNLELMADGTDYTASDINEDYSRIVATGSDWNTWRNLNWYVHLNAGEVKLLKLTCLVNTTSWCVNVKNIEFTLSGAWDDLQKQIQKAQLLLDKYSQTGTVDYSKVSDKDRTTLTAAIAEAKKISSSASAEIIGAGSGKLSDAIDAFNSAISSISAAPGIFDFPLYQSKSGGITINNDNLGSTNNNATVIYKFLARETGLYTPYIAASTDVDASSSPRVCMGISENLVFPAITNDWTKHLVRGPKGWNSFSRYEYPQIQLEGGKEYYMKMTFLANSNWVANMNEFGMRLDEANGNAIYRTEGTKCKLYPNPAEKQVCIEYPGNEKKLNVFVLDMAGCLKIEQIMSGSRSSIDVSAFSSGLYLVKLCDVSGHNMQVLKLIVK